MCVCGGGDVYSSNRSWTYGVGYPALQHMVEVRPESRYFSLNESFSLHLLQLDQSSSVWMCCKKKIKSIMGFMYVSFISEKDQKRGFFYCQATLLMESVSFGGS